MVRVGLSIWHGSYRDRNNSCNFRVLYLLLSPRVDSLSDCSGILKRRDVSPTKSSVLKEGIVVFLIKKNKPESHYSPVEAWLMTHLTSVFKKQVTKQLSLATYVTPVAIWWSELSMGVSGHRLLYYTNVTTASSVCSGCFRGSHFGSGNTSGNSYVAYGLGLGLPWNGAQAA